MYKIGRYIHGISLNGVEWLLNESGELMKFENFENAKEFLKNNGYQHFSDENLLDNFIFQEITAEICFSDEMKENLNQE